MTHHNFEDIKTIKLLINLRKIKNCLTLLKVIFLFFITWKRCRSVRHTGAFYYKKAPRRRIRRRRDYGKGRRRPRRRRTGGGGGGGAMRRLREGIRRGIS